MTGSSSGDARTGQIPDPPPPNAGTDGRGRSAAPRPAPTRKATVHDVAYQPSGNGMSGQCVFSALSFAAAGLLAVVISEGQSSTSASLAGLRSAQLKSICINKAPH